MKRYYTYVHRDASGAIFYVGCATTNAGGVAFKWQHQRAYSKDGHTAAWLEAAHGGHEVEVLEHYEHRDDAFRAEKELIARLRAEGQPLVNICDGGPGAPGMKDSVEARLKKAVTKLGKLNPMFGKTGAAHPNSRKVRDGATGAIYESVKAVAEATGHRMKTLYNWLSGHRPNPTALEFAQ